jgi:segregation and condensation protein B
VSEKGADQAGLPRHAGEASAALEAVLFASGESIDLRTLAEVLGWTIAETRAHIRALDDELNEAGRGLQVQWHDERVALTTAPRFGALLQRFYQVERTIRLSEAALETLAIIAVRQPVTRAEIEAVRGVDSTGVLSTLVARELVEVGGRRAAPGSPLEYRTTEAFLQHFGLAALDQLRQQIDGGATEPTQSDLESAPNPSEQTTEFALPTRQ